MQIVVLLDTLASNKPVQYTGKVKNLIDILTWQVCHYLNEAFCIRVSVLGLVNLHLKIREGCVATH